MRFFGLARSRNTAEPNGLRGGLAACVLTECGRPWRSTIAMIFRPFPRFVAPISAPSALGHRKDRVDETFFFIQRDALAKLVGDVGGAFIAGEIGQRMAHVFRFNRTNDGVPISSFCREWIIRMTC